MCVCAVKKYCKGAGEGSRDESGGGVTLKSRGLTGVLFL